MVALAAVILILYVALRHGKFVSRLVWSKEADVLLLSVLGLTLLVAGLAAGANISSAVGAFLVGIAISGPAAKHAQRVLTPLRDLFAAVFFLFFGLSTDPADLVPMLVPAIVLAVVTMAHEGAHRVSRRAARRHRRARPLARRVRADSPRRVLDRDRGARRRRPGVDRSLAALATAYVLITMIAGPLLARIPDSQRFKAQTKRIQANRRARQAASPA